MNKRTEQFYREKEKYRGRLAHIKSDISDPVLRQIDELYGAADGLSISYARKHQRTLLLTALLGTLLTFFFLLYDEVNLYGMIFACGVLLVFLFVISHLSSKWETHQKYLEYRVLAETMRVQFYLYSTGSNVHVRELLPWSTKTSVPWILEVLDTVDVSEPKEKQSILGFWVNDQKSYHERALEKAEHQNNINNRVCNTTLLITVGLYFATLLFELVIGKKENLSFNVENVRTVLKILLGTMSAVTLFMSSYYGKMSLQNVIEDYRIMIGLYRRVKEEITEKGESDEIALYLARECLNENSVWYRYQSRNAADMNI